MHVFFFNDTATTEIYTLSLHDALPISASAPGAGSRAFRCCRASSTGRDAIARARIPRPKPGACDSVASRSEEHTSELQSHLNLVCRLLLEKKKVRRHAITPCGALHTSE